MKNTYAIIGDYEAIKCLVCGLTSYNTNDIKQKYCGNCNEFHDTMMNRMELEWKEWLASKPLIIQELANKFPPGQYRIKDGAPYGVSCSGTLVNLFSYLENGNVGIVIMPEDKLPKAIEHEKMLGRKFNKTAEEMHEIITSPVRTEVEPIWLEFIE